MESDKEELKKYLKKSSIESNLDEKEIGLELKTSFEAFEKGRFPDKLLESSEMIETLKEIKPPAMGKLYEEKENVKKEKNGFFTEE